MDVTQILLVVVIAVLTTLFVVIGVQVVYILQEVRKSLQKMNKMLDDTGNVTSSLSRSFTGMTGLVEGIKTGLSFVNVFGKKRDEK